ncbi:MAG TPA: hypothetical protein DCM71_09570 [Runella sp.]|nr:hypothetical protein [Runella sp.]
MNEIPPNPYLGGRRSVKDVTPMGLLDVLYLFFLLRFSLAEATFFNAFNLFPNATESFDKSDCKVAQESVFYRHIDFERLV